MDPDDTLDPRERFLEQLQAYVRPLRKVCSAYAARVDEREDLFQEVCMQLWRAWPSFRGDSSFGTWAFRVALNTLLFRRRTARSGRRVALWGDGTKRLEDVPAPSAPDPAASPEAIEVLHECIRSLRELDRAIVLLHLEERPHQEIADIIGLSVGNVAVRLHRSRAALRACLEARGIDLARTP